MNFVHRIKTIILQIVLVTTEFSEIMCLYETYFMDSYCSTSGVTNSKGQSSTANTPVIQLGKDSCNSVAILRSFKTEYPNNGIISLIGKQVF